MTDLYFGTGSLTPFADDLWTAATPVRFAGSWFPHVMAVVRLKTGELLLYSPCKPSAELLDAIAQLGAVAHVVAPNWFHDLYLKEYRALYASATFWGPAFLQMQHRKVIDRVLPAGNSPWFEQMPHVELHGLVTFNEYVFFHRATRTLIVADLLMNLRASPSAPPLTRLGYRFLGLEGSLQVFPVLRWFSVGSRASLRSVARQIAAWAPERLVVGHGTPLASDANGRIVKAFAWLA